MARESIARINREIVGCRACPRLVEWRERVAREKVARFSDHDYWGRPVPGFGDPFASLIVAGAFLLTLPLSSADGRWTPPLDAFFTATSALCLTGLVVLDTGTYWSGFGLAIISSVTDELEVRERTDRQGSMIRFVKLLG